MLKTSDFDYYLPKELIAQHPLERRDSSRLAVFHRDTGELEHRHFSDVTDYLRAGDVLVINDTRVIPARMLGVRATADVTRTPRNLAGRPRVSLGTRASLSPG